MTNYHLEKLAAEDLISIASAANLTLFYNYDLKNDALFINRLEVHKNYRNQGRAPILLSSLSSWADQYQKFLLLIPSDSFGSDLPRLIRLYQKFGFLQNSTHLFIPTIGNSYDHFYIRPFFPQIF